MFAAEAASLLAARPDIWSGGTMLATSASAGRPVIVVSYEPKPSRSAWFCPWRLR